jgi:Leucine-rich repeat (LRR) protein
MGAKLNRETCRFIGQLEQLETLGLDGSDIRDAQVGELASLKNLRILWLSKTELTDAAVEPLGKLTGLTKLYLSGSRLSSAGLKTLRQALPGCEVVFEEAEK